MKAQKPWGSYDGLEKMRKYCAFQERCRQEVWTKLMQLECPSDEAETILQQLREEKFLDEARFVAAYVRGHFNQKSWGKIKIRQALRIKQVDEKLIQAHLQQIDPDQYFERIVNLAAKKAKGWDLGQWEPRQKLKAWLMSKGFEGDLVDDAITAFQQNQ